ncbi:MAG: BCCT family transporter, partial [Clostridiales bacterium]|nr:BCCT family transporter [Clostridiales bacterium]
YIRMATWTDPLRVSNGVGATSGFPQDWTIFYWAYWIAWCVATPFFIAKISKGRSIKQIVLGGGLAGLLGTFASFIVFGGAGLNLQTSGVFDAAGMIAEGAAPAAVIVEIICQLPWSKFIMAMLFITMIGLYASTFDALTDVVSCFSYKTIDVDETPSKWIKIYWAAVFLVLPIALVFLDTTNQLLQSVAIIGAFPLSFIMIFVVISFFKDVRAVNKPSQCLYVDNNA